MAAQEYYNSGYIGGPKPDTPFSDNGSNRPWTPASSTATPGHEMPYSPRVENRPYNYGAPPPPTTSYGRPQNVYPSQPVDGMAPGFSSQTKPQQYDNEYNNSGPPPYTQHYGSQQPHPPYPTHDTYPEHPPTQPPYPQDQKDERGFMGAVAGGAVGAYAGHQVHHGVLGTIGGAITGSLTEDAIKKHKKKKEKKEGKWGHGRCSSSSSSSGSDDGRAHHQHHRPAEPSFRGNFSASSTEISLEHNYELTARCRSISGELHRSGISLNSVLSNHFGSFVWARGGNFGGSARNVHLAEGGRILDAELADGNGHWKRAWVRLDERITNQNGHLVFLD